MSSVVYKENYIIYSNGMIWSLRKKRMLRPTLQPNGYSKVYINGKNCWLHRVICSAFYGDCKLQVDHIDGNKENNDIRNLEFVTQEENIKRMFKRVGKEHLVHNLPAQPHCSKSVMWNDRVFKSFSELARELGVDKKTISYHAKKGNVFEGSTIDVLP